MSEVIKKPRKSNFSPEEVDTLLQTVRKHYGVLYGQHAKKATNKMARHRCWLDVMKKVNQVSLERRTLQEVKNKWKKCQHAIRRHDRDRSVFYDVKKPVQKRVRRCGAYDPRFKAAVITFAEEKSSRTAANHFGISLSNVRRWRRSKFEITQKADRIGPLIIRKSQRPKTIVNKTYQDHDDSSLDSMPLEQRVAANHHYEEEQHNEGGNVQKASSAKPVPVPQNEEVCLRWNSHHSNIQTAFPTLLIREQFVDVTLVAEGRTLKCHKLILSSCSPYFEEVFNGISPLQHPVLFLKDTPFWIVKSLCDYMYAGEIHIFQNRLEELLAVAESLKIKGLAGKNNESNESPTRKPEQRRPVQTKREAADSGDELLDPLDLLEPVYEEVTKENKPSTSSSSIMNVQDNRFAQLKRNMAAKRIKKRKFSEDRETPDVFQMRKGTRSRPNVKVPKFYNTHYSSRGSSEDQDHKSDVLDPEDIKPEPYDDEDENGIEIENNAVNFTDDESPNGHPEVRRLSLPILLHKDKHNFEIIDMSKNRVKVPVEEPPMDSGLEIIDTTNNKIISDPLTIAAIQARESLPPEITLKCVGKIVKLPEKIEEETNKQVQEQEEPQITITDVRTVEQNDAGKYAETEEILQEPIEPGGGDIVEPTAPANE